MVSLRLPADSRTSFLRKRCKCLPLLGSKRILAELLVPRGPSFLTLGKLLQLPQH
jgi:hypothetical protein